MEVRSPTRRKEATLSKRRRELRDDDEHGSRREPNPPASIEKS
jgi:hypothetical protein